MTDTYVNQHPCEVPIPNQRPINLPIPREISDEEYDALPFVGDERAMKMWNEMVSSKRLFRTYLYETDSGVDKVEYIYVD